MFAKTLIIICCSLAASQAKSVLNTPSNLFEAAESELEIVKNTLLGSIKSADFQLGADYDSFKNFSRDVGTEGQTVIEYQEEEFHEQVSAIEEEAQSAGVDISDCLGFYQGNIDNIKSTLLTEMQECISREGVEVQKVIGQYKAEIDNSIHKAYALEDELKACIGYDDQCVLAVYNEIENAKMYGEDFPEIELISVNNLLNQIRSVVQDCANLRVSRYASGLKAILEGISGCADALIN